MIVIVVLGIIATLTIPALVNKQKESVAKTKVRKAMAAYESALNKMIIENDLKSDDTLATWAGNADSGCANSTNYFKKVQGDGCKFKTSDGIWWDISNIERPIIAFNQDNLTIAKANAANDYSAFVLVGRFGTDGSLRVDDLAYETANSVDDANGNASKAQVEKLYSLLMNKKFSDSNTTNTCETNDIRCIISASDYQIPNVMVCAEEKILCVNYEKLNCDDIFGNCPSGYAIYDENGNNIGYYITATDNNGNDYIHSKDIYYGERMYDGARTFTIWDIDSNNNIYKSAVEEYNSDGSQTSTGWSVDSNGNIYLSEEAYCYNGTCCFKSYDNSGEVTYQSVDCD